MKKKSFLLVFMVAQIIMVVLHIHKYSKKIELSFELQKNEQKLKQLMAKHQQLRQELSHETDRQRVAHYATTQLQMKPIHIWQVKRMQDEAHADHL